MSKKDISFYKNEGFLYMKNFFDKKLIKEINKSIILSLDESLKNNNLYSMFKRYSLNEKLFKITKNTNFSELCITSDVKIKRSELEEISVVTAKAEGKKCPVCWKIIKNGCKRFWDWRANFTRIAHQ